MPYRLPRISSPALGLELGAVMLVGTLGCQSDVSNPQVSFENAPALGSWPAAAEEGAEGAGQASPAPMWPPAAGTDESAGSGAASQATAGAPSTVESSAGTGGGAGESPGAARAGGGTGGASGAPGTPVEPALGLSQLRFEVLTHSLGGKYSPKNIGAIWIETGSGAFVKTLEVWAGTRARYLSRWRSEAASSRVDAVSGATLRSHVMHTASWDLTDVAGSPVAPGDYKVVIELTDHDGPGATTEVAFTRGDPVVLMPSDQSSFTDMLLTLQ